MNLLYSIHYNDIFYIVKCGINECVVDYPIRINRLVVSI